ncbi:MULTISPECIES: hypothetical protein [Enterobacteriaceae]|nr:MULTISPECIES: hypothetical protein [Enterobacteriaceae]
MISLSPPTICNSAVQAAKQAERINEQLEKMLGALQERPDVRNALGGVLDGTVQAGKELQRMREALAALSQKH